MKLACVLLAALAMAALPGAPAASLPNATVYPATKEDLLSGTFKLPHLLNVTAHPAIKANLSSVSTLPHLNITKRFKKKAPPPPPPGVPFAVATPGTGRVRYPVPPPQNPVLVPVGLDGRPLGTLNVSTAAPGSVSTLAICPPRNTLCRSTYLQTCSIVSTFPSWGVFTCTAWIFGTRFLATAGHCLYLTAEGGFAIAVDVFCTDAVGCAGRRTTTSRAISVTGNWFTGNTAFSNPYDGGVIQTRENLPFPALANGPSFGNFITRVLVSRYPGRELGIPNSPCQAFPEFTGCRQASTEGSLRSTVVDGWLRPDIDSCQGFSGGGVWSFSAARMIGILTAGTYSPCQNWAVPLRNRNIDAGCNGAGGGVSISCLARLASGVP